MPNVTLPISGNPRINGRYGRNPSGQRYGPAILVLSFTAGAAWYEWRCGLQGGKEYFDTQAFKAPATSIRLAVTAINLIGNCFGNAPGTGALNLTNPGAMNLDTGTIKRKLQTGAITERYNVVLEADAFNTWPTTA